MVRGVGQNSVTAITRNWVTTESWCVITGPSVATLPRSPDGLSLRVIEHGMRSAGPVPRAVTGTGVNKQTVVSYGVKGMEQVSKEGDCQSR